MSRARSKRKKRFSTYHSKIPTHARYISPPHGALIGMA
jgi:hypothetical protein